MVAEDGLWRFAVSDPKIGPSPDGAVVFCWVGSWDFVVAMKSVFNVSTGLRVSIVQILTLSSVCTTSAFSRSLDK